MLNNIKNQFSISDFENLSGIKAHTIRIWEKRYDLFNPTRHGNNERLYDIEDLKKLLNISFLYNNSWKISKIAKLEAGELQATVKELATGDVMKNEAIKQFKLAMFSFDVQLFNATYFSLLQQYSFREIFQEVFIPLLDLIGFLWQTNTISPSHEHFISQLIENKLHINIEKTQSTIPNYDKTFVLFLPENEIHNLGLLYIQYELLLKSCHTIFLGHSIPICDLQKVQEIFDPIIFVTQFIVNPPGDQIHDYLDEIYQKLLQNSDSECWVSGHKADEIDLNLLKPKIKVFKNVKDLLNNL
jgi:DNA-binding transcriptional MerR regulator